MQQFVEGLNDHHASPLDLIRSLRTLMGLSVLVRWGNDKLVEWKIVLAKEKTCVNKLMHLCISFSESKCHAMNR